MAEPGAVVFNNKVYLFFVGVSGTVDFPYAKYTIGLAISEYVEHQYIGDNYFDRDGFNFSEPVAVLDNYGSTAFPRNDGWFGYSTPAPTLLNGQIHLYHGVYKKFGDEHRQV